MNRHGMKINLKNRDAPCCVLGASLWRDCLISTPKKVLRMRKLTRKEIGNFRLDMMNVLAHSPDPFVSVMHLLAIDPCREFAKSMSAQTGKRITLTHVLNKLLAVAIAENPLYNQIILGNSVYQMEEIHIANAFLLPGPEQALTSFVLGNPHLKSLEDIQEELRILLEEKTREYMQSQNNFFHIVARLYFKTRLYKCISEKLTFTIGFQKGMSSNIMLSNHVYNKVPANFIVLKPVIAPIRIPIRVHPCGIIKQPHVEDGRLTTRGIMPFHVVIDHRIIHGIHVQQFGQSLERITSNPEKYL